MSFTRATGTTAGIPELMDGGVRRRFRIGHGPNSTHSVPCAPLGTALAALGMAHVDLLSLDVQGAELLVLNTLRWREMSIGVLLSECKRLGCTDPQDTQVSKLVVANGLVHVGILRARHDVWDSVFVNRSLLARD